MVSMASPFNVLNEVYLFFKYLPSTVVQDLILPKLGFKHLYTDTKPGIFVLQVLLLFTETFILF